MEKERLFLVTYDVSDPKRWRRVFKTMKGFGQWIQLSVFQCVLNSMRFKQMEIALRSLIEDGKDHILIIDIGPVEHVKPRFMSLGKPFKVVERKAVIV